MPRTSPVNRPRPNLPSPAALSALARNYTEEAIQTLAGIMRNKSAPVGVRASVAFGLLDRGWGKPVQQVDTHMQHELKVTVVRALDEGRTIDHEEIAHESGERGRD